MPDGKNADDPLVVVELVDDPVGADAKRPQPPKASSKSMACLGFAFEEAKRLDNGIG